MLALRNSAWEEVTARPPGIRQLADSFPISGNLQMFDWKAGDSLLLNFPRLGVVDASPRQLLGVTRTIYQVGLGSVEVAFRQRPRNLATLLRNMMRRFVSKQRNYQGQMLTTTSTPGASPTSGATDAAAHVPLPSNIGEVARAEVTVFDGPTVADPWYLYVNDVKVTSFEPVTKPGVYDITAYVARFYDQTTAEPQPQMKVEFKAS